LNTPASSTVDGHIHVEAGDHWAQIRYEPFDSELLGLRVGRTVTSTRPGRRELETLLRRVEVQARAAGFDQLIRRVDASAFEEIWALESTGHLLMDVGVTFARRFDGPLEAMPRAGVAVRTATGADIERLLETMLDVPWGSRYEADPAYDRQAVQALQSRWLRNSLAGRADHVLVGHVDGQPAGYVTCRLIEEHGEQIGEIDLVGTVPAYRGRGVAATIVQHSLAWFSTRISYVTVRTQATNTTAAGVYERSGMTLRHSDMTFRRALTEQGGRQ
jgi:ribosomal protein S18 acetylase RimI-like enzyme